MNLQFPHGNTTKNDNHTGSLASLTVDDQTYNLRLHDGSTPGGVLIPSKGKVEELSREATNTREASVAGQNLSYQHPNSVVAFHYKNSYNHTIADGENVKFNSSIKSSTHFNDTEGSFTAPVAGVYHFTAIVLRDGGADTSSILKVWIDVNGSGDTSGMSNGVVPGMPATIYIPLTATLQLSANDVVSVKTTGTVVNGAENSTYFTGFLL